MRVTIATLLKAIAASALLILCLTGMALADWQGTVWNSSPEEADKAFLVPHRASTQTEFQNYFGEAPIVFDAYQVGDLAFTKGHLNFRDGRLYQIWMSLKDPRLCEKLIAVLKVTYGTPAKDETTLFPGDPPDHDVSWYDQKQNNQVNVFYRRYPAALNYDDDCDLKYEPFVAPSPGQL
jgi:hypothetical protein